MHVSFLAKRYTSILKYPIITLYCIREHCYMTHNVIGSLLPDAYTLPASAYTNDVNLLWYRSCVPLHKGDTIPVINPLTLLRWINEFMYIIGWIGECKLLNSLLCYLNQYPGWMYQLYFCLSWLYCQWISRSCGLVNCCMAIIILCTTISRCSSI